MNPTLIRHRHNGLTFTGIEPIHAPAVEIELTVAAKHANKLTIATVHLASNDVQSNLWKLVLRPTIDDVRWFSISTRGKPDKEH